MTAHQSGGALHAHDADQEVEVEVLAVQHTEELRWRRRLARGRGPLQVDGREGLVLQKVPIVVSVATCGFFPA